MNTALPLLLLLLAVSPLAGLAVKRPVRTELRSRPTLIVFVIVASALVVTLMLAWTTVSDMMRWTIAMGAMLIAAAAFVRARPSFGLGRGLPPGSLSLGASLDALSHADFLARAARQYGPVFKMAQFHRPTVCIVDLPLGLAVMEEQENKLAPPTLPFGRLTPGNYIEFLHDEQHPRYRAILRTVLNGAVVEQCRDGVAAAMREQLSAIADWSAAGSVDLRRFLDRMAIACTLRVVFGVSVDDARLDELQRLYATLGRPRAFSERRPEERVVPYSRLLQIFRELGEEVRVQHTRTAWPLHSVFSEILRADADHLRDDTVLGNLVLIVHVTRSNIRGLLGWTFKEYFDHPEIARRLQPSTEEQRGNVERVETLAASFVNETLRLHQSEYFYREVKEAITVGSYRVPKGWLLRVCVRESHDNPDVFPDPRTFKADRFVGRHFSKLEYCPFSDGTHSCFGARLSLMIARTLVMGLARHFDGRCVADGPVERSGNRHWSHWQPSSAYRLALSRRAGI